MADDQTLQRLDDEITWYNNSAIRNQWFYKSGKVIVIIAAAAIPFLSGLDIPKWQVGLLGVLIAVVEGMQQLNQYHANWISYRSSCEALKHEKFLYFARAGIYANAVDAKALLAERTETLVSQETSAWATSQVSAGKKEDVAEKAAES